MQMTRDRETAISSGIWSETARSTGTGTGIANGRETGRGLGATFGMRKMMLGMEHSRESIEFRRWRYGALAGEKESN